MHDVLICRLVIWKEEVVQIAEEVRKTVKRRLKGMDLTVIRILTFQVKLPHSLVAEPSGCCNRPIKI